jgi:hypothetical protein
MGVFYWHGAVMALAWLVLLPAGALIARFYKVRPGQDYPRQLDDRYWRNTHRILQSVGAGLAALAAWWAYDARGGEIDWPLLHVQLGAAALALCAAQIVVPLFRGTKGGPTDASADPDDPLTWQGDHYDMSLRRRLFEAWHKNGGYAAMALAVGAVWTGIGLVGLEEWWKWPVAVCVGVFAALFTRFSLQGRRVDTWSAIWGPDGR